MTPSELIYKLLKDTKTTQTELAKSLGYKSAAAISNRLNRGTMNMDSFMEILNALGYEMIVRPKVMGDVRTEIIVTK